MMGFNYKNTSHPWWKNKSLATSSSHIPLSFSVIVVQSSKPNHQIEVPMLHPRLPPSPVSFSLLPKCQQKCCTLTTGLTGMCITGLTGVFSKGPWRSINWWSTVWRSTNFTDFLCNQACWLGFLWKALIKNFHKSTQFYYVAVSMKFCKVISLSYLLEERQGSLCSIRPLGLSGSSDSSVTYIKLRCFQYLSFSPLLTTEDRRWNFW